VAQLAITVIRRLTSPRRPQFRTRPTALYLAALVFRLACAGLLVWVAAIHLHLWSEGYRQIPTIGRLFLADAVAGFVLAALLLVWPSPLAGLLGAGFMVSTLVGLILSINIGLFGFQESIEASFVIESILLESIGTAALLAWAVLAAANPPTPTGPHRRPARTPLLHNPAGRVG
jgi:membrane-bound ClpP family serine protease